MVTTSDFGIGLAIAGILVGIVLLIRSLWNLRKVNKDNKYTGRKP